MPTTLPLKPVSEICDIDAVVAGHARLTLEQAIDLYHHAPLHDLGRWATAIADRMHGNKIRTYVIDRNINYTNVCSAKCTFCAFRRDAGENDSYTLDEAQLHEKIRECADIGGTQILLQGGMNPDLPMVFYVDMLRAMRETFPGVHLHAFSPPEFVEFVACFDVDGYPTPGPTKAAHLTRDQFNGKLRHIMERLREAGMASLPGGGGEILVEHIRRRIGSTKATGTEWLDVMRIAHQLGMFTSATMMFGHIEGVADRFMHMQMIRDAQDEAMRSMWPGRYVSFISWPFQPDNTPLGRVPQYDPAKRGHSPFPGDDLADGVLAGDVDPHDAAACRTAAPDAGKQIRLAGAAEYLRTQALSRLFFDNIHSIGASWVTMGPKIGQLGLKFGANDMGSVMMEENVVSAAGTTYCLNEAMICRLIRDAGYVPAQRDNTYNFLKTHEDAGPDTQVADWSAYRPAASAFETPDEFPTELTVNGD
jgi:cyclic dehypoxanthinyl futalosine synthase